MDGFWGAKEYSLEPQPFDHFSPHLAFLPLPTTERDWLDIFFRRPNVNDFTQVRNPGEEAYYVLRDAVKDNLSAIVLAAHRNLTLARKAMGALFHAKTDWESVGRRAQLFRHLKYPAAVVSFTLDAYNALIWWGAKSQAKLELVWSAMQRGLREFIAFVNFCIWLLPSKTAVKELRNRLQLSEMLDGLSFRGSILCGSDVAKHYNVFAQHGAPVFALLRRKEYYISNEDRRLRSGGEQRSSYEPYWKLGLSLLRFLFNHFCAN
jgi:hypothetical protein